MLTGSSEEKGAITSKHLPFLSSRFKSCLYKLKSLQDQKLLYMQLTFHFAEAPFAVPVITVCCTTPWLDLVSSNAVMIHHAVVSEGKLTACSVSISTVRVTAI